MNFSSITIKDIAAALNLSVSTVSKALRDSYEISEGTKKLVNDYAAQHNYRPNPTAQSLKQGRSQSIGIVVSTIDNQFFSQVINGIESVAYEAGFNVIITQTHESYSLEVNSVKHLAHHSVDGLLISLSTETQDVEHLKELHRQGLPIVFFDRVSDEIETHKVIADNFNGGYNATLHLLNAGYKRIAHITGPLNISIAKERFEGYAKALKQAGVPVDKSLIKYCAHGGRDVAEIENALNELLALQDKPDAIFTTSDRITTLTLSLLHQLKLNIPRQIALVGYTNTTLAGVLNPSLSAVSQPGFEMGQKATQKLLELILAKMPVDKFETLVLPTQLTTRDSTAPKNAWPKV
ncbi:LacI family DNA-binding transcriptional regulator [Mucilaginibacter phyllosphaerae]|uniref:LacI family transcriptional regulator n=1 Tax=Mucilaginibacter phyllosphaerae TaxID=1812349 RepID=A0A4Y8AJQ5_9SPHI|nr:LacI family DNA-binding transcriptional regulator [Mucilaginibacter phyllosphaerae]MBB3967688.1 LacI family transcriptional regulator [Mucilaginibacter phyllosphaerae]TEW69256.1 LacI family transcriptional regulator [Mucilaginibacter phyllosphaerae]GGH03985.1 LacI family transcriptional regulator [Mucilaginibacter phyllosphaerae]